MSNLFSWVFRGGLPPTRCLSRETGGQTWIGKQFFRLLCGQVCPAGLADGGKDIGSEEALSFVRNMKNESIYNSEGGLKSVVDLYATP